MGLPKEVRLRRSEDFRRVNRVGRRFAFRHLVVRVARTSDPGSRFGLAVSRKVGNAVVRNRVKRWLREAIRHQRSGLTGWDVVFIALPSAATAGYATLSEEVSEAFVKLRSTR